MNAHPMRRWPVAPKVFAVVVFTAALWVQSRAPAGLYLHDGLNVIVAKAIAAGDGLRYIHLPNAPPALDVAPLYPLVLSLGWLVWPSFPGNLALMAILDSGALAAAAWILASHAETLPIPRRAACVGLALGFLSAPLLGLVGARFGGPLALALFAGAVATADGGASARRAAAAGAIAGLATLANGACASLVAAIPVALTIRGGVRRGALAFGTALAVIAPWLTWALIHSAPAVTSDPSHAVEALPMFTTAGDALLRLPVGLAAVALAAWGGIALFRLVPSSVLGVAAYAAVLALEPAQTSRSVWIVLPWLGLFAAVGTVRVWAVKRSTRGAVIVAVTLLLMAYVPPAFRALAFREFAERSHARGERFRLLAVGIAEETAPEAMVGVEVPELVYLYADRATVAASQVRDTTAPFCAGRPGYVASAGGAWWRGREDGDKSFLDSWLTPVFELTDGPALYAVRCPD